MVCSHTHAHTHTCSRVSTEPYVGVRWLTTHACMPRTHEQRVPSRARGVCVCTHYGAGASTAGHRSHEGTKRVCTRRVYCLL